MTHHVLVIGAQRCGTTLLYELLDAHPSITMARPRRPEPKVFLSDERAARGVIWYHQTYFAHATTETVYGEKSTSYIEDPQAPKRASQMLGQASIVAQLRDPVERAISNWRFSHEHGVEQRPLEVALLENLQGPRAWDSEAWSVSPFAYLERGRYVEYLRPWLQAFPSSTHIQLLEDEPRATLGALYATLGVDSQFSPTGPERRVNESEGARPQVSEALMSDLRAYFRDSDSELSALLGRSLPWPSA